LNYQPFPAPSADPAALRGWMHREFLRMAAVLASPLTVPTFTSEPRNLPNGTIVYADGTLWNPGNGEGFYGMESGAWRKL
jgi:hypothetical protein